MVGFEVPEIDYTRYSNRQLAAVPLAVLALALLVILGWYVVYGYPVEPGIAFSGGVEMRIQTTDSPAQIEATFSEEVDSIRSLATTDAYIVRFKSNQNDPVDTGEIQREADAAGYETDYLNSIAPSFGGDSQRQALLGVGVAFIGMSVLVFLLFRTFVPSIAVVASAFSDIVIPVALMNIFGIELSLGTVAALLMLIGYSVDSDLLLNNHVLRRRGGFYESAYRAMRTGVTMTLTSLSAMIVMTIVAYLFGIQLLTAIGIVLVFGLAADLMNTYMLNMSLLRYYKYEGVAR